jgi:hypothetical protein
MTILATKMIDIDINEFVLIRGVLPICFFSFFLLKEANLIAVIFLGLG